MTHFNHLRKILLVLDGTQSAAGLWPRVAQTADGLLKLLPESSVTKIALLGSELCWQPAAWQGAMPLPPQAQHSGSFLAPVMMALRRQHETPRVIIIIGNGEIFDLEDWVNIEKTILWGLVRVGDISMQPSATHLLEFPAGQIEQLLENLDTFPASIAHSRPSSLDGFERHTWMLDRTGYPMIYIEPLRAYWHLFPITKPQFESFLAQAKIPGFGDDWYSGLLQNNTPRRSPCTISEQDYEAVLMTSILPSEVLAYTQWHAQGLHLPNVHEWRSAWKWLDQQDISVLPFGLEQMLSPTAYYLWRNILEQPIPPRNLLDISLMRGGILEWALEPGNQWLGMGKPKHSHPFHNPLNDLPLQATSLERRSRSFGFRLIRST